MNPRDTFRLKFYDEDDDRMLTVNHVTGLNDIPLTQGFTSIVVDCSPVGEKDLFSIVVEKIEHLIPCSGIKDSLSRLVFRGDIVEFQLNSKVMVGVVVYDAGEYRVRGHDGDFCNLGELWFESDGHFTVIGHQFTHKKLSERVNV